MVKRIFNGKSTRNQVLKEIEKLQMKYKHKNLKCMLSVIIPEVAEHRSGKAFILNDKPILEDDYDWDETDNFILYFWKDTPKAGGDDDLYNDCFVNSIAKVHSYYRFPKDIKNPEQFKTKFGLERCDKVPVSLVPEVEKVLQLNINIAGDYFYTSKNLHKTTVNLLLIDEHYTPKIITLGGLLTGIPKMEHKLIVYKIIEDVL